MMMMTQNRCAAKIREIAKEVGRLNLATYLGISYSTLGNKINGYCPFTDEEIELTLKLHKQRRTDETES
jgi:hypothetical protein